MTAEAGSAGAVSRIMHCRFGVSAEPWAYAERHKEEISAHWQRTQAERPALFDGTIYLLRAFTLKGQTLSGTFVRTDFKSFLHWRECALEDESVREAFGSSAIRSSEGHLLLGRQRAGQLNVGLAYPPSGVIDARDVVGGSIDIDASIVRELDEETGLAPADLEHVPGYVLTVCGRYVSIAIEWRSTLAAEALRARILSYIRRQESPELADIVIVRSASQIGDCVVPPYTAALASALLTA